MTPLPSVRRLVRRRPAWPAWPAWHRFVLVLLVLVPGVGAGGACGQDEGPPVLTVLAASSLRDLLGGLQSTCERELGGVPLEISFAASSLLSRRIEAGGEWGVFLSADAESLDRVASSIDPTTRTVFLENRLALVGGVEAAPGTDACPDVGDPSGLRGCPGDIAVGGAAVPVGRYARSWLADAGLLDALRPRFQNARNVRAALTMVASGAVPFGFVYASDARSSKSVRTLWTTQPGEAPRIEFVAAAACGGNADARAFLAWLRSETFLDEARGEGFLVPSTGRGE